MNNKSFELLNSLSQELGNGNFSSPGGRIIVNHLLHLGKPWGIGLEEFKKIIREGAEVIPAGDIDILDTDDFVEGLVKEEEAFLFHLVQFFHNPPYRKEVIGYINIFLNESGKGYIKEFISPGEKGWNRAFPFAAVLLFALFNGGALFFLLRGIGSSLSSPGSFTSGEVSFWVALRIFYFDRFLPAMEKTPLLFFMIALVVLIIGDVLLIVYRKKKR